MSEDSNQVFKLFTEKLGGIHIGNFIPKSGEIFYDPAAGELRISDGSTPGGLPLFFSVYNANFDGGTSTSVFGPGDLSLDGGGSTTIFNNTLDGGTV